MIVTPITHPLPGEHLVGTSPTMRPHPNDSRSSPFPNWRKRLRYWSGRALTADALNLDQENRAAHLAWRGRQFTAGIVNGLATALETPPAPASRLTFAGHYLHLMPGHGITALGEDVIIPRPLRVALEHIPLENGGPGDIPWASVIILRPAEFRRFNNVDPNDPCELDPSRDPFADERRQDATLLRLVPLPPEWATLPEMGDADDPSRRNRLAYFLFEQEAAGAPRQLVRFRNTEPTGRRWDAEMQEPSRFDWNKFGIPLALLSSEVAPGTTSRRWFLDRTTVVRSGGQSPVRSRPVVRLGTGTAEADLNPPGSGSTTVWRARIDQFAEHVSSLDPEMPISDQARSFRFVPPAGLLPKSALRLLTTDEARLINAPDRAASNRFFPASLSVEAVPVPLEDLDATLAASAPLAPFDFGSDIAEQARILVPLPQQLFDPQLLVVEQEDSIFAKEIGRLVAERQDWRQRRDFVRDRQRPLRDLVGGPQATAVQSGLEPGQLEPEPTETLDSLGFVEALLSPEATRAPWEIAVDFAAERPVTSNTLLFVQLCVDADAAIGPFEVRWRLGQREYVHQWATPPDFPEEQLNADGQPLATPLWRRFHVKAADIGITRGTVSGFTLRVARGRVALSQVGQLVPGQQPGKLVEDPFWRASDRPTTDSNGLRVQFSGGDWIPITASDDSDPLTQHRLLAPFEQTYTPLFENDQTLTDRLDSLDSRLRLSAGQQVRQVGLNRIIADLERKIKKGDDSVDLGFLKAQANIHRVRQVILGDEAANELLTSPVLNSVVDSKSARLTTDELLAAYKQLPNAEKTDPAGSPRGDTGTGPVHTAREGFTSGFLNTGGISFRSADTFANLPSSQPTTEGRNFSDLLFRKGITGLESKGDLFKGTSALGASVPLPGRDDVVGSEPIIGKSFELRTLSFAKRFNEGATRTSFNYADAELRETVGQVLQLQLGMEDDNDEIPEATDGNGQKVTFGRLASEGGALLRKLQFTSINTTDDSSAILSRGVRRADATVLILRRFEFHLARLRETLHIAKETLAAVQRQIVIVSNRLLTLEGRLGEARHDVSVARALRVEEQARVAEINNRRDQLIRDEVRFLAFVRPRAVDPARRSGPYWRLDPTEVKGALPNCGQQHDEPPDALRAYVQLFRQAPARWFTELAPRLAELNTRETLAELMISAQQSAFQFISRQQMPFVRQGLAAAPLGVLQSSFARIATQRRKTAALLLNANRDTSWSKQRQTVDEHASLGDVIDGQHGNPALARTAARVLEQIETVATCLHANFAALPPSLRLVWIERYSEFDRPTPLDELSRLPQFGNLPRETRGSLQQFADWLFGRVNNRESDAFSLINDLIRICLLLASHAPVKSIIAGHIPRPLPVRPGIRIPLKPLQPAQVRVGMQFRIWRQSTLIAEGRVEDLQNEEVTARVEQVATSTTTVNETMRVQFIPAAFKVMKRLP